VLGTAFILAVAGAAQVPLKPLTAVGDRIRVDVHSELSITMDSADRENRRHREITQRLNESYVMTVDQTLAGMAGRFSLVCTKSATEREGSDIKATGLVKTPRDGKTIIVTRTKEGGHAVTVETTPGGPQDSHVGRWEEIGALLPASGSARLNDRWQIAGAERIGALAFFSAGAKPAPTDGELTCQVVKIEGETATISIAGTLRSAPSEDDRLTLNVNGTLVFDGSKGRPVSLAVTGALELNRNVVEEEYRPETLSTYRVPCGTITVRSTKWESSVTFSEAPAQ
jgi:hypothetical protein